LPNEHYEELWRDAQKMNVSVTAMVNFIIHQHFENAKSYYTQKSSSDE